MHITVKQKEDNSVSKHRLMVYGALHNFTVKEISLMLDIFQIPYSVKSLRTTYYRAKEGKFKQSGIEKHLLPYVEKMFDTMCFVKICIDSIPKEPKPKPTFGFKIEGDFMASINNPEVYNPNKK